jgi:hypothetical protein
MTDDQEATLRFAAEHHAILPGHIEVLLDTTTADAEQQLADLTRAGLVRHHRAHHAQPGHYQITNRGLAAIDSPLPEPRFETIRDHRTQLALPWLTLAARRDRFGPIEQALTERVTRHHDTTTRRHAHQPSSDQTASAGDTFYGVALGTGIDKTVPRHYPPLLLLLPGQWRVAFEVHTRQPPPGHLAAQIAAYAADPHIDTTIHLTTNRHIGNAIINAAEELGLHDTIRVQSITVENIPAMAQ